MRAFLFLFVLLFYAAVSQSTFAQDQAGNLVVVTKMELNFHEGFSNRVLDSLTQIYDDAVTSKNEYVLEHKTVRHLWGNDNRDYIVMFTVKSFEDVEKANERNGELFREKWTTKEERDAFNKAFNKYFTGKHSDEIYQQVKFNPAITSNE